MMRKNIAYCFALMGLSLLAGCASNSPIQQPILAQAPMRLQLRLSPASLDASVTRLQHLKVERDDRIDDLDAALEFNAQHLKLVGLAFGQRVLSLDYDGHTLKSWRHTMLPKQVQADDVLQDMQLTLWPESAISKALPLGWRIADEGLQRKIYMNDKLVTEITYSTMPRWDGTVILENFHYHYRLTIQSTPAGS